MEKADRTQYVRVMLRAGCGGIPENGCSIQVGVVLVVVAVEERHVGYNKDEPGDAGEKLREQKKQSQGNKRATPCSGR